MLHKCDDCGCVKDDTVDIVWEIRKPETAAPQRMCELCRKIKEATKIHFEITAKQKEIDSFQLVHEEGQLFVEVMVEGHLCRKNVTSYFEKGNPHDDWLDYRMGF